MNLPWWYVQGRYSITDEIKSDADERAEEERMRKGCGRERREGRKRARVRKVIMSDSLEEDLILIENVTPSEDQKYLLLNYPLIHRLGNS